MMRKKYIQDPTTGDLLPAGEYYRKYPPPPRSKMLFAVKSIDTPFVSTLDGSTVISSRRQYDKHCAEHNVVPVEELSSDWEGYFEREKQKKEAEFFSTKAAEERKRDIAQAIDAHKDNEFPTYQAYVEAQFKKPAEEIIPDGA